MDQYDSKLLFRELKRTLKERKVSYRELATRVSFSVGTIKNLFHFEDAAVGRIFEIAKAIGVSFPDLVAAAYAQNTQEFSFTEAQEEFFAERPEFYNFFREVFFGKKTLEQMKRQHALSERAANRYVAGLERVGVLERHLRGKFGFPFSGRLRWIQGGPWMRKNFRSYTRKITDQILASGDREDHLCSFSYATLSKANRDLFYLEIREVAEKYKDISYKEYLVGSAKDAVPVTWFFGMVPTDIVSHREDIPEI